MCLSRKHVNMKDYVEIDVDANRELNILFLAIIEANEESEQGGTNYSGCHYTKSCTSVLFIFLGTDGCI